MSAAKSRKSRRSKRPVHSRSSGAAGPSSSTGLAKRGSRRNSSARAHSPKAYALLQSIDGRHPLAQTAPSAVIAYPARRRRDSKIAFFNFALAREIGLLPRSHPDKLTAGLRRAIHDAFSLVIVNEWDEAHGKTPSRRDRLPHTYMATRYLQMQHPDKRGLNSGDGRSIWNGAAHGANGSWDISSCGTGVTRLCPATSAMGEFFQTGNALTDYGCGTAHVDEGIGAALMSEAFARNGVQTERVLAVLSLPSGLAINVRVAPNLLRPSHFFGLLRRRQDEDLRRLVLYYAEREISDGRWPSIARESERIRYLASRVAVDFARATARFESDYIFCWLEWDGDNILTDGSIIDYGSVRQFGLYHHRYRFKDTDRMSTSIPEQRRKARQIVQRFAQLRELLLTGTLLPLDSFRDDESLERFDREFETHRRRLFLAKLGFEERDVEALIRAAPDSLDALLRIHHRLERRRSSRGEHRVPDGLSWNAVYCMRDVLRELPTRLIQQDADGSPRLTPKEFYEIALSDFASRRDAQLNPYRRRLAQDYQRHYRSVIEWVSGQRKETFSETLEGLVPRAQARNPYARMTGDGLTHATRRLSRSRGRLDPEETFRLIQGFAEFQHREGPEARSAMSEERPLVQRIFRDLLSLTQHFRESL